MVNKPPHFPECCRVHVAAADDGDDRAVDVDGSLECRGDGCGAGWFGDDPGPVVQPEDGACDLEVVDGDDVVDETAHVGVGEIARA